MTTSNVRKNTSITFSVNFLRKHVNIILSFYSCQKKIDAVYGTTDHLSFYMIYVDFFGTLQRYSIVYVDMHNCFIYDSNASLQK